MKRIAEQKELIKRINLNTDGQSVIVQNGLRVRGALYKLTDGIISMEGRYIGFQDFYEKHGFLEECKKGYKIYLVEGASGIDKQVYAQEHEMQNPLIISKKLIKQLGNLK